MSRLRIIGILAILIVAGLLLYPRAVKIIPDHLFEKAPIKVGILHSLTGTMSISETSVVDATLLAIEELNTKGGVLGRRILPIVADGRSDPQVFASEALRLIVQDQVSVVFGCWTSASRKTVKPIFEEHHHLLLYPVQYEGLEQSPNIIYMGAAPNQQVIPAVKWCIDNIGNKFFLAGSDYVFPRTANAIAADLIAALGGEIAGEEYILLGQTNVSSIVAHIVKANPDVILNTINGDSNVAFFEGLRRAGVTPERIPTMSFSVAEGEIQLMSVESMVGSYACWNYFQSVGTAENREFVRRFKAKYGSARVTSDPMAAAYSAVYIWAQAVEDAGSPHPEEVLMVIKGQSYLAPEGVVFVDRQNNHTWRTVNIGRVLQNGQFDIVWNSKKPVEPVPYPPSRSRSAWQRFLLSLYEIWGGTWANPGLPAVHFHTRMESALQLVAGTLARDPRLVAELTATGAANSELSNAEIQRLDQDWTHMDMDAPLISSVRTNRASAILTDFAAQHPEFVEIFATDTVGLNAAVTRKTSDYFQGDEAWWNHAFNMGNGRLFYGDLEYDRSAEGWGAAVYAPVTDTEGKVAGIIKAFLSVPNLLSSGEGP